MTIGPAPNRVLVPVDLSGESERAILPALRLASRLDATVCLFSWSFDEGEAAAAKRYLIDLAGRLPAPASVQVTVTDDSSAAPSIAGWAAREGGTICMATIGRSGLGHALLGSVAEETLRLVDQPLVLVGPHVGDIPLGDRTALVAGVDGSALSAAMLPVASAWARRLGLPLHLVHVVEPGSPYPGVAGALDALDRDRLAQLVNQAAGEPPLEVDLLYGDPATAIAGFADRHAELLAVATHGRTGLARAVLGSVALRTVHRAHCPVLVVRTLARSD
ncbi:MAG: universal stress protein [Acidimicrobiales bacterium]